MRGLKLRMHFHRFICALGAVFLGLTQAHAGVLDALLDLNRLDKRGAEDDVRVTVVSTQRGSPTREEATECQMQLKGAGGVHEHFNGDVPQETPPPCHRLP